MSNVALLVGSYVPAHRALKLRQMFQCQMNTNLLWTVHAVGAPNDELPALIVRAKNAVVFVVHNCRREL